MDVVCLEFMFSFLFYKVNENVMFVGY